MTFSSTTCNISARICIYLGTYRNSERTHIIPPTPLYDECSSKRVVVLSGILCYAIPFTTLAETFLDWIFATYCIFDGPLKAFGGDTLWRRR